MVTIKINGKAETLDNSMLFGDLLKNIGSLCNKSSTVISSISINGKEVSEVDENNYYTHRLDQMGEISFKTSDPVDLAFEALISAQAYIKKIVPYSIKTGEMYSKNNIKQAENYFLEIVDSLEHLCTLLNSSQHVLRSIKNRKNVNDSSLRIAQVRLVSAIQELLPAKTNNDYKLLANILSEELPESLMEMCNLGIPVLQRIKTAN